MPSRFVRWRDSACRCFAPIPTRWSSAATGWSGAPERWPNAMRRIGGETIILGKPHRPIYETAMARFAALAGGPVDQDVDPCHRRRRRDRPARRQRFRARRAFRHRRHPCRRLWRTREPRWRQSRAHSWRSRARRARLHPASGMVAPVVDAALTGRRARRQFAGPPCHGRLRMPDSQTPPASRLKTLFARRPAAGLCRRRRGDRQFRRRPPRPRRADPDGDRRGARPSAPRRSS